MNYLDMMRLKRLSEIDPFASNIKERVQFPTSIKEDLVTSPLEPVSKEPSILDSLRAQRATPRLRNYENYLESEPRREDHQSGKLSKLLAAVSGTIEGAFDSPGRGLNTYKGITDMPYITARQDWESKGGRLKELVELEHRGLSDEEKRLVQLENFRLKGLEEARTWYKDQKAMELSDARIDDITNRIKISGKSVENNEITGEMEVVDKVTGSRVSLGKFAESIPDKTKRENRTWFDREGTRQKNRLQVQDRAFGQQINLESIRTLNDGELARYRSLLGREDDELKRKLDGMSPAAQKTALELAFQQATLDHPELQEDDPGNFMVEVRKRLSNIRKRTGSDFESNETSVTTGEQAADAALKTQAVKFLIDNNFDENDEENIANAMKKILEESSNVAPPNAMPQVSAPTSGMMDIPPELQGDSLGMPNFPKVNWDTRPPWADMDPRIAGELDKTWAKIKTDFSRNR